MSKLDAHFQFKIGDMVTHKLLLAAGSMPAPGIVVERMLQECPGGVHKHYTVRSGAFDKDGCASVHGTLAQFNEIELAVYPGKEEIDRLKAEREDRSWQAFMDQAEKRRAASKPKPE